jgi:hypothetical protein
VPPKRGKFQLVSRGTGDCWRSGAPPRSQFLRKFPTPILGLGLYKGPLRDPKENTKAAYNCSIIVQPFSTSLFMYFSLDQVLAQL